MKMIRVGIGGIPLRCTGDVLDGIRTVAEIGLDCTELEFVRQVYLTKEKAVDVKKVAQEHNVGLSVHASYFLNLASGEAEKITASKQRILKAARIGDAAGADIVVFHPGFYSSRTPDEAGQLITEQIAEIRDILNSEGNKILLGPETTGKVKQFGTLDELLELSKDISGVNPVVDFGHMHARYNGCLKSEADFEVIFKKIRTLGKKHMHCHFSGIEYTEKSGERKHLPINSGEPDYTLLVSVLKKLNPDVTLICESPRLEEDALKLKKMLAK